MFGTLFDVPPTENYRKKKVMQIKIPNNPLSEF